VPAACRRGDACADASCRRDGVMPSAIAHPPSPGACRLSRRGADGGVVVADLFRKAFHIKGNDDLRWVGLTQTLQVF
jgi:hypothetical protein